MSTVNPEREYDDKLERILQTSNRVRKARSSNHEFLRTIFKTRKDDLKQLLDEYILLWIDCLAQWRCPKANC